MIQTPYIAIEALLLPLFGPFSRVGVRDETVTRDEREGGYWQHQRWTRPDAILGNANVWTITIYGLTHPFRN